MFKENKYAQFWIEDGILHFLYKPNVSIDLGAAKIIVKERLRFQDGIEYPILCDLRQLKFINKPARDYLARQGSLAARAVALIVEKPYSEKLSEVFLKSSQPSIPTREFTENIEALNFLKRHMEENKS